MPGQNLTPTMASQLMEAQVACGKIHDPQSGEKISLDEALSRNILDPAKQSSLQRAFNIGKNI